MTPTCLVTELNGTRRRQSQPGSSVAPPRESDHERSALSVPFPPTTFGGAPTTAAGSNEASLQRMAPRTRRARAELSGDSADTESGRARESRVMGLTSAEEPSTTLTTVMTFCRRQSWGVGGAVTLGTDLVGRRTCLRQRARLVGGKHGHRAERLDGLELLKQHEVLVAEALGDDGQPSSEAERKSLRDEGNQHTLH